MRHFFGKCKHLVASLMTVGLVVVIASGSALAACRGDNGDVKIHNTSTIASDQRDEPKVCEFYLDAFNFDGLQDVQWHIVEDTHGATVLSGDITLDQNGQGVTHNYTLSDGMYKLYWNFASENGSAKHKVFKVDCAPETIPPSTPTPPSVPQTPPVVGRGGEVLSAATTAPTPVTATLANTGINTIVTSLLSLIILSLSFGVVSIRRTES